MLCERSCVAAYRIYSNMQKTARIGEPIRAVAVFAW